VIGGPVKSIHRSHKPLPAAVLVRFFKQVLLEGILWLYGQQKDPCPLIRHREALTREGWRIRAGVRYIDAGCVGVVLLPPKGV